MEGNWEYILGGEACKGRQIGGGWLERGEDGCF